jgi:hypothetical protein
MVDEIIAGNDLLYCRIINEETGKQFDVMDQDLVPLPFSGLTINENMFQTGVHGVLNLTDSASIVQTLPVRGGERLEIGLKNAESDDRIDLKFYIHKVTCVTDDIQERNTETGKVTQWKLEFTTYQALYLNYTEPVVFEDGEDFVSKIVSDDGDEQEGIVNAIAKRFFNPSDKNNSRQNMDMEPTSNSVWLKKNVDVQPFRKPVNQVSVLKLMNYLSEYAVPKDNDNAVNYLFYEDLDGWYFRSINSIIKNSSSNPPTYFLDEASEFGDIKNAFSSFTTTGHFSPIKMFEKGSFLARYLRVDPDYSDPYHDFVSSNSAHKKQMIEYKYLEEHDKIEKIEEFPLLPDDFEFEPETPVQRYDKVYGYFSPSFYNDQMTRLRHDQTTITKTYRSDFNHLGNTGSYSEEFMWQSMFDQTDHKAEILQKILEIRKELKEKREELAKKKDLKERWSAYRCSVCCMSGFDDGTTGSNQLDVDYKIVSAGTFTDTVNYDPTDERANEKGFFSSYDFENDPVLQETMQSLYRLKPPDQLQGVLFGIDAAIYSLQRQAESIQTAIEVCSSNPCPEKKQWVNENGSRSSQYVDDFIQDVYQYPGDVNSYPCAGCYELVSECTGPGNENQECSYETNCYARVDANECILREYPTFLNTFQKSVELLTEYKEALLSSWNKFLERKVFVLSKEQYLDVPEDLPVTFQNVKSITRKRVRGSRYEVFALKRALVDDVADAYDYLVTYNGFAGGTGDNHPYYNQTVATDTFGNQNGLISVNRVYGFNTPYSISDLFVYPTGYGLSETGGVGPRTVWLYEPGDLRFYRNNPSIGGQYLPLILGNSPRFGESQFGSSWTFGPEGDFVTTVEFGPQSSIETECTEGNYGYWKCVDNAVPNAGGLTSPITSPPPSGLLNTFVNETPLTVSEQTVPCCGVDRSGGCAYLTPSECSSRGGYPIGFPGSGHSCSDCEGYVESQVGEEVQGLILDGPPPPFDCSGCAFADASGVVICGCPAQTCFGCCFDNPDLPFCGPDGPIFFPPAPPPPDVDPDVPDPYIPGDGGIIETDPGGRPDEINTVCNEWEWVVVEGQESCQDYIVKDGGATGRITGMSYRGGFITGSPTYFTDYRIFEYFRNVNPDTLDYCKVYGCYDNPEQIYELYYEKDNWYVQSETYQVPTRFFSENQHYIRVEFSKPVGKQTLDKFPFGFVRDAGTEYYAPYIVQLTAGPFGRQSANYNMSVIGLDPFGFDIAVTRTDTFKDYSANILKDAGQPFLWEVNSITNNRFDPINKWVRINQDYGDYNKDGHSYFVPLSSLNGSGESPVNGWHEIKKSVNVPNMIYVMDSYVAQQIYLENNEEALQYLPYPEFYAPYIENGQYKRQNTYGLGSVDGAFYTEDYMFWDSPENENLESEIWKYDISGESEYGVIIPDQNLDKFVNEDYRHDLSRNFSGQFVVFSREVQECPDYECANPDGPVTPPSRPENPFEPFDPYINCPVQELRPDFVEDGAFDQDLSEPSRFEIEQLESEINECDLIQEKLGDDYLGCLYSNPNASNSCNCPNRGSGYSDYLAASRTYATFWDTPHQTPLRRQAQMTQFTTQQASGMLAGDVNLRPGTIINLLIPSGEQSNNRRKRDSGKWLVTGIQHVFTQQQHFMTLSCNRESSFHDPNTKEKVDTET